MKLNPHGAPTVATPDGDIRQYGPHRLLRRDRASGDGPNVLFLSLDDCNDWVGYLRNHPGTHTPNIDALAAESLNFSKAYCSAPICKAARNSVLFGLHPFESGVYDHYAESNANHARLVADTPSLIDDFWAAGYATLGAGKVFHDGQLLRWNSYKRTLFYADGAGRGNEALGPGRFDENWLSPYNGEPIGKGEGWTGRHVDFGPSGREPDDDPDGVSAGWIREQLRAEWRKPFLLAFGVIATHVPWRVPQRFFDMHPLESIVVPDIQPYDLQTLPSYARESIIDQLYAFETLNASGLWARSVQAYQASMSYTDYLVGTVLDTLASSRYADDTIVVLWSDHGFHLGEMLHFHKFTLWERATHVPFLLKVPGATTNGTSYHEPVSMLDLGPTLAPLCDVRIHAPHSGADILPEVLGKPHRNSVSGARPVLSTWQEHNFAIRQGPWRYIRYRTGEAELYDHRTDPDERSNLANRPAFAALQAELDAKLPPGPDNVDHRQMAVASALAHWSR